MAGRTKKAVKAKCCSGISEGQLNEAIRQKAQELFEKSGRKPGRDMDNWLEAEKEVKTRLCGSLERIPC